MKTLIAILALTFSVSTFASCDYQFTGSYREEVSYSVPLSEFSMNSWQTVKKTTKVLPIYFHVCTHEYAGAMISDQHFPSVSLASFGMNSWKVAK